MLFENYFVDLPMTSLFLKDKKRVAAGRWKALGIQEEVLKKNQNQHC